MIKKFNEYNTNNLDFTEDEIIKFDEWAQENLIELVDDGYHIFVFATPVAYDAISILIKNKPYFEYPFPTETQNIHFIDFLNTLSKEYNISRMSFTNTYYQSTDVVPINIINGGVPGSKYSRNTQYLYIHIEIKKKI